MRLIDADQLITMSLGKLSFVPKEAIDNAITVDAVEVVRCKDCKWWNGYYRECESHNWNTGTDEYIVQPAGMFCG